jgi:hypothetical protein
LILLVYSILMYAADPPIARSGAARLKKGGIAALKGWQDRWLVLTRNSLKVYKNVGAYTGL